MVCLSPDGLLVRLVESGDWQIVFWRGGFNFLALALFFQVTRPGGLAGEVRRAGWPGMVCAAIFAVSTIAFIASLSRTTVANTLLVLSLIPLAAALLGLAFLRERVPPRTWLAIAVALSGFAVIVSGSLGSRGLIGDALALVTALSIAGILVIIRANPFVSMFPALAMAGLVCATVAALVADPFAVSLSDVALMAVMGCVQQAFAIGIYLRGASYLPPAEAGLIGLIETVLGPFWVWLVIAERPSPEALIGGSVVIAALALHSVMGLRAAVPAR